MWFLYPFGLVDRTSYLVIGSLIHSLVIAPHSQDQLHSVSQLAETGWPIGKIVAVGPTFVLVPACANAEIEAPMAEGVHGAGHLGQERRMAITVAGDQLSDADALRVGGKRGRTCPALKSDCLRGGGTVWKWSQS